MYSKFIYSVIAVNLQFISIIIIPLLLFIVNYYSMAELSKNSGLYTLQKNQKEETGAFYAYIIIIMICKYSNQM